MKAHKRPANSSRDRFCLGSDPSCGLPPISEMILGRNLPGRRLRDQRPVSPPGIPAGENPAQNRLRYTRALREIDLRLLRALEVLVQRHGTINYPFTDRPSIPFRITCELSGFG